jgi:hypothetical protein
VSPRVVVPLVNRLADVHAWGRDVEGWWALISWSVYGTLAEGHNGHVHCSAWVPAAGVHPSNDPTVQQEYRYLERLDLPADRSAWPTPAASTGRQWHHYGAITTPPTGPTPGLVDITGRYPAPLPRPQG